MDFTGQIATVQQRLAACQEMAARRNAVVQELNPRRGERVLEVGCGAGLLLRDIGLALGPHGLAAGVDVSEDQIAAAFWHGPEVGLTAEIASAWEGHAAWPNLPARLQPMLARGGFGNIRTLPVPIVNPNLHENTFAYWIARLMAAYAVEKGVARERADGWLSALDRAEAEGEFFFSSVPILTTAIAA